MEGSIFLVEGKCYQLLKDLNFQINGKRKTRNFSISFWVYLPTSTSFPTVLLHQVNPILTGTLPFLVLNENKNLMLFPLRVLHKEAPHPGETISWTGENCASSKIKFPLNRWVHVGCQISFDLLRLYVDGIMVGEKPLSSTLDKDAPLHGPRFVSLSCTDGEGDYNHKIRGYVNGVEILSLSSSMESHFQLEDSPLQLHIDESSALNIEEDTDGVWSIIGGKASCLRNFSLDVILTDGLGQLVNKDLEVVASLLYKNNEAPVEKPADAEAPLLTIYDGIEYASWDRPSKLINGRASFKLRISQLSSKCDKKLFCISFDIPKLGSYPFFRTITRPIRSIFWNHNSSKRVKLAEHKQLKVFNIGISSQQINKEGEHPACISNEDVNAYRAKLRKRQQVDVEADSSASDLHSQTTIPISWSMSINRTPFSDSTVSRYCLEGVHERSLVLKKIAVVASEQDLLEFSEQEGTKAWRMVSENNHRVLWENLAPRIIEQFKNISCCSTRDLTPEDLEVLRKIAGCQEFMACEHFERLWCWLYPVALMISQEPTKAIWESVSRKWIEGFITKEEAESSLQGLQQSGTFVLRFPTSRSWPHPDAGNLVVTYVGGDRAIHHRLLSLDVIYRTSLQEMIFEDSELLILHWGGSEEAPCREPADTPVVK